MDVELARALEYAKKIKKWSGKVDTEWSPKEGTFDGPIKEIVSAVKRAHPDLQSAMSSINFYVNRQGKNMSPATKSKFNSVKQALRQAYGEPTKTK